MFEGHSVSEFSNERPGNLVHWRIVCNDYRSNEGQPCYFVYRVVESPGGKPISEYLTQTGEVDGNCGNGWFEDYADIGVALIKNQAREEESGYTGFYTFEHRRWLAAIKDLADNQKEIAAS